MLHEREEYFQSQDFYVDDRDDYFIDTLESGPDEDPT